MDAVFINGIMDQDMTDSGHKIKTTVLEDSSASTATFTKVSGLETCNMVGER